MMKNDGGRRLQRNAVIPYSQRHFRIDTKSDALSAGFHCYVWMRSVWDIYNTDFAYPVCVRPRNQRNYRLLLITIGKQPMKNYAYLE